MSQADYRAHLVQLAGLGVDNPNLSIADLEEIAGEDREERALRKLIGTGTGTAGGTTPTGTYYATYTATY